MSIEATLAGALSLLLLAGGKKAAAQPKPKLPAKPLGKPPAKVTPIAKPTTPALSAAMRPTPVQRPPTATAPTPPKLVPTGPEIGPVFPRGVEVKPPERPSAPKPKPKAPLAKPLGKAVAKQAPKLAQGAVPASPVLEPNRGSLPAGYKPASARARARAIAAHLATKGPSGYSHPELKSWQLQAGLTPDGLYGGSSRGALIFFGVKDPPRPFFKPVATLPYVPPEQRTTPSR